MASRTRLDTSPVAPVRCLPAHTLGVSVLPPIKTDAVTFYFHEAYGAPKVIGVADDKQSEARNIHSEHVELLVRRSR